MRYDGVIEAIGNTPLVRIAPAVHGLRHIARAGVGQVAGSELVAEEIVRTLVGSIGLVASVPLTTLLAALVVNADRLPAQASAATPSRGGSHRHRRPTSTPTSTSTSRAPAPWWPSPPDSSPH